MPTEEKIKLYNELNPSGKTFPVNKKPDEKAEDMEWLDKKLAEFWAFDNKDEDKHDEAPKEAPKVKVQISSPEKIYTVAELLHMSFENHAKAMKEVKEWRAKVVNK